MHNPRLRLKKHCDVKYEEMRIEAETPLTHRSCARCETAVHDVSARTERDAHEFLRENPGACIRFLQDTDGQVVHVDRPPRVVPSAWLVRGKRAALIAATVASASLAEACGVEDWYPDGDSDSGSQSSSSTGHATTTSGTSASSTSSGSSSSGSGSGGGGGGGSSSSGP
ncbi:MAG: hypothetical protein U0414_06570 [Polyangiaceae bacterium]